MEMDDFVRFNKISGVRWLKTSIEDIKLKIKLKPQDNILSLPRFEDDSISLANDQNLKVEEHVFKWQQKVFSARELRKYSDIHNCVTDTELRYYDFLKTNPTSYNKVFTYTNEDGFISSPWQEKDKTLMKNNIDLLSCLQKLNMGEILTNNLEDDKCSMKHLIKSQEFSFNENDQWIAMHILFDKSEYNKQTELILNQDAVLMSVYWNERSRCFVISPDTNSLEWNPYTVETMNGVRWNYQYAVELELQNNEDENERTQELVQLLKKLRKKWNEKHKVLLSFVRPPIGLTRYYVTLEIISAIGFEEDNLYVEYEIKLSDDVDHNAPVKGRTHTAQYLKVDENVVYNFSHIVDFSFDLKCDVDLTHISFYMEVISQDWWGRHRTEGYAHLALCINPGQYNEDLNCVRPEEKDKVFADSRRYFIGGCNLLDNLELLRKLQGNESPSEFRFVTTGKIGVRWSAIRQVPSAASEREANDRSERVSSSALLMGADAALRRYRRARATLAAAAKGLDLPPESRIETSGNESNDFECTEDS